MPVEQRTFRQIEDTSVFALRPPILWIAKKKRRARLLRSLTAGSSTGLPHASRGASPF